MAKQSRVGLSPPGSVLKLGSVGQAPPYMTFSLLILLLCFAAVTDAADVLPLASQKIIQNKQTLQRLGQLGIDQVIFTTRLSYDDGHWYANIGYYCDDENKKAYAGNGKPDESMLYLLDVAEAKVRVLFDSQGGSIRDPHLHYDGRTVLFSYRRSDSDYYNLYEMTVDATGLRRITDVPYDDFEATYLPNDDIVFVSTRSKRWVGCWMTQVGTLFRCDRNGRNLRPLSVNLEHDNTPAVLPDGRILYTRWEYVDRSQVGYHHLWTMNPNGTNVAAYFGNQQHYPLYIEPEPIPGTDKLLLIDSPGHGRNDHRGYVCIMEAKYGPDDMRGYRRLTPKPQFNDPAPIGTDHFIVASYKKLLLGTQAGELVPVLTYQGQANIHEPIPVMPRPRERVVAERGDENEATGRIVLADVYAGRNMDGISPGEIKELLVLEALPKPVNFSGGMDLTSWLGTFMLERVLGTVPVEADGSAYFEVPAGRPVLFVALDADGMSVKRMQSFTNVMPGETLGCVGCHEQRMQSPVASAGGNTLLALKREPSRIKSFAGLPDVIDFRRHVQPILDEHCVKCHNFRDREGRISLTDDLGFCWSMAYFTLLATNQVADGRNGYGNQKPRTIGSSASELMRMIDGSHYDVTVTPGQWRTIWMWLESGAPYAGTYAALRNAEDQKRDNLTWAVFATPGMNQRCRTCHRPEGDAPQLPLIMKEEERRKLVKERGMAPHERIVQKDDFRFSSHVLLNLSRPELSPLLLGPLPKEAGGWGTCPSAFTGKDDIAYKTLLAAIEKQKKRLREVPRFGTPEFKPNKQYVREMKRFGVLPADFDLSRDPIDVFETDQRYWEQFWYRPQSEAKWAYLE
ncbi:MAG: HzsA-related protein [Planctomycetota bacterium]